MAYVYLSCRLEFQRWPDPKDSPESAAVDAAGSQLFNDLTFGVVQPGDFDTPTYPPSVFSVVVEGVVSGRDVPLAAQCQYAHSAVSCAKQSMEWPQYRAAIPLDRDGPPTLPDDLEAQLLALAKQWLAEAERERDVSLPLEGVYLTIIGQTVDMEEDK